MAAAHQRPGMRPRRRLGWLAAVLGLVSQLALGSVVLPDTSPAAQLAALDAAMIDCAPANPGGTPRPRQLPHRHGDPAVCPLSVALALPSVVLSPAPILPPPRLLAARLASPLPAARAPPPAITEARYPRGPPILA